MAQVLALHGKQLYNIYHRLRVSSHDHIRRDQWIQESPFRSPQRLESDPPYQTKATKRSPHGQWNPTNPPTPVEVCLKSCENLVQQQLPGRYWSLM